MTTTTVSIRMDEELKKQAEQIFSDMGMNMSTAFTIFTKAVVRTGEIPFRVTTAPALDPYSGEGYLERLRAAAKRVEQGHYSAHELIEV